MSQDTTSLEMELPWLPNSAELPIISFQLPNGGNWEVKDGHVDVALVEAALAWLIATSPAYVNVRVDFTSGRPTTATKKMWTTRSTLSDNFFNSMARTF